MLLFVRGFQISDESVHIGGNGNEFIEGAVI